VLIVLVSVLLAKLGSKAFYVIGGIGVLAVVLYSTRDLWMGHLSEAVDRLRPAPSGKAPLGRACSCAMLIGGAVLAGVAAFALGHASSKVLYALAGLFVFAVAVWLFWPLVRLLFDTKRPGTTARSGLTASRAKQEWEAIGLGRSKPSLRTHGGSHTGATMLVVGFAAALVAFGAAKMGSKALLALFGLVVVVGCLVKARDKTLLTVFGTMCALAFLVHKTFGPLDLTLAGGAPSVYITSFDAMVVLLYALWFREGTLRRDLRLAFQNRIMWVPLIGAALLLSSLLAQGSSGWLALAELVRMGWMYLLFVYVATRVRSREMVWAILGGLAAFAALEIVVVLLQWKTHGVLGLSFLGVPTHLTSRITDSSQLGRPFGTIIHPDFMGATMGAIGLVALAISINLRRSLLKVAGLLLSAGCLVCLYLAHTRTALAAWVLAFVAVVAISLARRRLRWSTVAKAVVVLLIGAAVFFPQLEAHYKENFGTGHFSEEIESRYQLNDVALAMFDAHPLVGVGLNSFQNNMGPYEEAGVIFIQNPVQNLYLLYLGETGLVGSVGFVLVGVVMFAAAVRLERSRDRLMSGLGLGITAAMVFLAIEELMDFALRQDVPLAVYWIFAGLAVACLQMTGPPSRRLFTPGWTAPDGNGMHREAFDVRDSP
jgi:hypothetical protein